MDKDDQYKNLEFVSKAYSVAEGAFPLWEAVFALIVGQILIAFQLTCPHRSKIRACFSRTHFIYHLVRFSQLELSECRSYKY